MPLFTLRPQKSFAELTEREILALAITLEEEDGRIYRDYAEGLRADYPASAAVFGALAEEETERRRFVLQVVQPGLAGLMDGSVSTLAPVFAAAFATGDSWDAFLVGIAASIGAGISMGFAEALSDDGNLTGRGHPPWLRGAVCGAMTTLGGLGHTLPFLIPDFRLATTLAIGVTLLELWAIAWIRARYMDTPLLQAAFQVVGGGFLVFVTGIVIGSA
jgi:erythrin-vacuolar iron transport family protein